MIERDKRSTAWSIRNDGVFFFQSQGGTLPRVGGEELGRGDFFRALRRRILSVKPYIAYLLVP